MLVFDTQPCASGHLSFKYLCVYKLLFNSLKIYKLLIRTYRNQFRAINVVPNGWGMVAHNFNSVVSPITNVVLYGRSGLNQHDLASVTINAFFNAFNEKLDKEYIEIDENQDGSMHIFALPDTNMEWIALSTICIW